jgi:hypothetical protein
MAGPSNTVANAAPIPTRYFSDAVAIQMQSVGNTGTQRSHMVDYPVLPIPSPLPSTGSRLSWSWPWEHWAPTYNSLTDQFRNWWNKRVS